MWMLRKIMFHRSEAGVGIVLRTVVSIFGFGATVKYNVGQDEHVSGNNMICDLAVAATAFVSVIIFLNPRGRKQEK